MSQHFLFSATARTLSARKVMELSNDQAFAIFKELRLDGGEKSVCPSAAPSTGIISAMTGSNGAARRVPMRFLSIE